ncbi:MAG: tRNA adenosine(34) deaminase TadA [Pseudomonadota bacterium]|nr:tRNA adenosine(34) deaminase TadA [Pseudomonadota bacterium]
MTDPAFTETDRRWMRVALAEARRGEASGEVPIGAVLVSAEGACLGRGHNRPRSSEDPTAHAEVVCLRAAARTVGNYRLLGSTLYVTVEPCAMCAGALLHARVSRLVYATVEPRQGAVQSRLQLLDTPGLTHRVVHQGGLLAEPAAELMQAFFRRRRTGSTQKPRTPACCS